MPVVVTAVTAAVTVAVAVVAVRLVHAEQVHQLVFGLLDHHVQPDAQVGAHHVHQAEPRQQFVFVD